METDQIFSEITEIVRSLDTRLRRQEIRLDDTPFRSYGLDSLLQMRLACLVEDRFDIDLTDKELSTATSVQRLVAVVEEKLRRQPEIKAS